jgi:hypothetical protein
MCVPRPAKPLARQTCRLARCGICPVPASNALPGRHVPARGTPSRRQPAQQEIRGQSSCGLVASGRCARHPDEASQSSEPTPNDAIPGGRFAGASGISKGRFRRPLRQPGPRYARAAASPRGRYPQRRPAAGRAAPGHLPGGARRLRRPQSAGCCCASRRKPCHSRSSQVRFKIVNWTNLMARGHHGQHVSVGRSSSAPAR